MAPLVDIFFNTYEKIGQRKLRLFALACCRSPAVFPQITEIDAVVALDAMEDFIDGKCAFDLVQVQQDRVLMIRRNLTGFPTTAHTRNGIIYATTDANPMTAAYSAVISMATSLVWRSPFDEASAGDFRRFHTIRFNSIMETALNAQVAGGKDEEQWQIKIYKHICGL